MAVEKAAIHFPFTSISGKPELTIELIEPEINIVKEKNGDLNISKIAKSDGQSSSKPNGNQRKVHLLVNLKIRQIFPGRDCPSDLVVQARSHVGILNAKVVYKDEETGAEHKLDGFNVDLKDSSLQSYDAEDMGFRNDHGRC